MKFALSAPLGILAARTGQTAVVIVTQEEIQADGSSVFSVLSDVPMEEGAAVVMYDIQPGQRLVVETFVAGDAPPPATTTTKG